MKPFRTHRGRVAPLDRVNVDTDQIIPKQFLKRIERTGYGEFLFFDWMKQPDFELRRPEYAPMAKSLREIGMSSAVDLFSTYAGRKPDLEPWLRDATLNRDRNLRLQYLAGLSMNRHDGNRIYHDILRYRTFPEDLFVGTSTTLWGLRQAIEGARE